MKKLTALLLSAILLLCVFSAHAETAADEAVVPAFKVITVLPEGYEAGEEEWMDPYFVSVSFTNADTSKPDLMLLIAYNDSMSDVTFNDETMKDEDIKAFISDAAYDEETASSAPYSVDKTGLGTSIVIFQYDSVTEFFTVWHGYEVALTASVTDENGVSHSVSEEQQALIMQFLTDLDIAALVVEE